MTTTSVVEHLFTIVDRTASALKGERSISYLEAIAETGENLFHGEILQTELSEMTKKRLEKEYKQVDVSQLQREDIRKSLQLAILKGMKEGIQANHQMTPDSVGLLVSYLVSKFTEKQDSFSILDPAVGTGNLLTTILNQNSRKEINSFGIDVDDLLVKLAYFNSNLGSHPVQFFNQDSLEQLFIEQVDVTICDLPVGYYPNDRVANNYQLKAEEGHSYAHHLFIEQSLNYTKEGGYLFFIVPNFLFESEQAPQLNQYIKEHSIIQGLIQLPLSMFKNEQSAKSIFIVQKKGADVAIPKQALLVNLPKLSNKEAMQGILQRIDSWFQTEKQ